MFRYKRFSTLLWDNPCLGSKRNASREINKTKIVIPPRIERGPLDILQALSNSVSNETGSLEYLFPQYESFVHKSNATARQFLLSYDSGKKTAQWVVEENKKLFQHKVAEPFIKSLAPLPDYTNCEDINEEMLLETIATNQVNRSIKLYEKLKSKNIDISKDTKQQLLQLVCYYNSNDAIPVHNSTIYYQQLHGSSVNCWVTNGFADNLFKEMEEDSESCSTYILGLIKHNNFMLAHKIYTEAKEKNIRLSLEVYNQIIKYADFKKWDYKSRWAEVLDILNEIKKNKKQPNLSTLNCCLFNLSKSRWPLASTLAGRIFKEFTDVKIEPCLATYYYLLKICYSGKTPVFILNDVLDRIENKTFELQDMDDMKFFSRAMTICYDFYKDYAILKRIHGLLNFENNKIFLSNSHEQSVYYRMFFKTVFLVLDFKEAINIFDRIFPVMYTPEMSVFMDILTVLEERKEFSYMPKIWNYIVNSKFIRFDKLRDQFTWVLVNNIIDLENFGVEVADEVWDFIEKNAIRSNKSNPFSSEILSNLIKLYIYGDEKDKVFKAFDEVIKNRKDQGIVPDFTFFPTYLEYCIKVNEKEKALDCLQIANSANFSLEESLLKKIKLHFKSNHSLKKEFHVELEKQFNLLNKSSKKTSDKGIRIL